MITIVPDLLAIGAAFLLFVAWCAAGRALSLRRTPERTCWVHCPHCHHDLNGDDASFVSDDEDGVRYICAHCGAESLWLFDAPVPLLLLTRKNP